MVIPNLRPSLRTTKSTPSLATTTDCATRSILSPRPKTTSLLNTSHTPSTDESPPIILTVTRRHIRKNKWVEVSGHYHLSLLTQNHCLPLILPRTPHVSTLLPSNLLSRISGLLLTEGEDISPQYFRGLPLSQDEKDEVGNKHQADVNCDIWKDHLEFRLVRECLERGVPILGICRGMQVVNLVKGGDMFEDVSVQIGGKSKHIDYENYDGFRHNVKVGKGSPLERWFGLEETKENVLNVTTYHHQGVKSLGKGLKAMAWSEDGLIEGYCCEDYDVEDVKFIVG